MLGNNGFSDTNTRGKKNADANRTKKYAQNCKERKRDKCTKFNIIAVSKHIVL